MHCVQPLTEAHHTAKRQYKMSHTYWEKWSEYINYLCYFPIARLWDFQQNIKHTQIRMPLNSSIKPRTLRCISKMLIFSKLQTHSLADFLNFILNFYLCLFACVCWYMYMVGVKCAIGHVWRTKDSLIASLFSFCHVDSSNGLQVWTQIPSLAKPSYWPLFNIYSSKLPLRKEKWWTMIFSKTIQINS